ncbi:MULTISPECIES: bifunctional DNA-formamidopyrimidine glycosylase/DNA-(apurinic or apyrimidinic site) lyase [unclassified Moraxella]|uniref:bifunctional DNA-formamidopyrimidine glycosylase/DNA-(apurinic or apyrimidinic site) lyase n=1 Tax=unclassified Moraxella TaxID=2685852 RepID=UPI00359ECF71
MPELPEVETTKKSLDPLLNQTVAAVHVHQPKLRYMMPHDLDGLIGFQLSLVERRAKYLLLHFRHNADNANKVLLVHLGMSGSLQQHPINSNAPIARKHDHLIISFGDVALHYHDPRRFGIILWADNDAHLDNKDNAKDRFLAHLGVEPLDDAFNTDYLYRHIHRLNDTNSPCAKPTKAITKPIKTLIMDQTVVVGVGNIYAAESLFLSGIHPAKPAHQISKEQIAKLVKHIKQILAEAIKKGGSTLRDFTVGGGKTGYFQQTLLAYGNHGKPCTQCGSILENQKICGRASVYCPTCQPLSTTKE